MRALGYRAAETDGRTTFSWRGMPVAKRAGKRTAPAHSPFAVLANLKKG
jgi:hypothetical protein